MGVFFSEASEISAFVKDKFGGFVDLGVSGHFFEIHLGDLGIWGIFWKRLEFLH